MTINQMRYFVEVCNCGNMTKAAGMLHISQPALSKAIKEIETECCTPLFNRIGNSIYPTEEGEYLYQELTPLIAQFNAVSSKIEKHELSRKCINVSYGLLSGFSSLIKILAAFKEDYPQLDISAEFNNTEEGFKLLDNHKVDLIVSSKPKVYSEEEWQSQDKYSFVTLDPIEQVFCVNKKHPLSKEKHITWEMMGKCMFVFLGGNRFRVGQRMVEKLKESGFYDPNHIRFTDQLYTAIQLVRYTDACTILHTSIIEEYEDIVGIPCDYSTVSNTYLIWRSDTPLFWAGRMFVDTARRLYRKTNTKSHD